MQARRAAVFDLVKRADRCAEALQAHSPECVLCHSDLHAGNVLITTDDTLYLVDWDAPLLAPKERDLMFIGGGVGGIWNNDQEAAWFYQGYGQAGIDPGVAERHGQPEAGEPLDPTLAGRAARLEPDALSREVASLRALGHPVFLRPGFHTDVAPDRLPDRPSRSELDNEMERPGFGTGAEREGTQTRPGSEDSPTGGQTDQEKEPPK